MRYRLLFTAMIALQVVGLSGGFLRPISTSAVQLYATSTSEEFNDWQKHKFLGGSQTARGDIYAMPSHSSTVLHIDPTAKSRPTKVRRIRPTEPFDETKFKWLRAVRAPDSSTIIGLPCWANSILKIDTSTNSVTTFGAAALESLLASPPSSTRWNWHGGQVSVNGYVYAVPANAERVLKVHPFHETVELVGPRFVGSSKWYGGILDKSNNIWCVPYGHDRVLKITPGLNGEEDDIREVGPVHENVSNQGNANYGWHGGVHCPETDCIYAFPAHGSSVLKIRCGEDAVETVGEGLFGNEEYKWLGGCVDERGCVWGVPSDTETLLRIQPSKAAGGEDVVELVDTRGLLSDIGKNRFQGAVAFEDSIFAIPSDAPFIIKCDIHTLQVTKIDGLSYPRVKDKFQGGFVHGDKLFFVPENYRCPIALNLRTEEVEELDYITP